MAVLLANGFHAAGIPTDFLLLRSGGEGEQTLSKLLNPGVRLHTAGPPMGSRHLELIRGSHVIRGLAGAVRPGLVLASSSNMGLVTGIACRKLRQEGIRAAMKLTNPVIRPEDRHAMKKRYRRALYRFIFQHHDRILTLSDAERRYLQDISPQLSARFVTVPNAYVPSTLLSGDCPKNKCGAVGPRLLTIARMMPQKRLDVLLQAFARLKTPAARLTILGDGPLRRSLENLSRSLGVADRVEMPGFLDDVVPALRTADLFVLSSDYEGLPAALIEALACNVPVVTTDCFFGARQMLERSPYCAVTPVGNPVELARAMEATLAIGTPSGLREIAAAYEIEASIAAHISALAPLLQRQ